MKLTFFFVYSLLKIRLNSFFYYKLIQRRKEKGKRKKKEVMNLNVWRNKTRQKTETEGRADCSLDGDEIEHGIELRYLSHSIPTSTSAGVAYVNLSGRLFKNLTPKYHPI